MRAIALRCGDPTPRRDGRMTLDPRRNIDAVRVLRRCSSPGSAGAGPVALDPLFLRDAATSCRGRRGGTARASRRRRDLRARAARRADSGRRSTRGDSTSSRSSPCEGVLFGVLLQGFLVNIALFVFNALPLPGLDGYAVVRSLLFGRVPRCLPLRRAVPLRAVRRWSRSPSLLPPQLTGGGVNPDRGGRRSARRR